VVQSTRMRDPKMFVKSAVRAYSESLSAPLVAGSGPGYMRRMRLRAVTPKLIQLPLVPMPSKLSGWHECEGDAPPFTIWSVPARRGSSRIHRRLEGGGVSNDA
jgi:hypothetical protein